MIRNKGYLSLALLALVSAWLLATDREQGLRACGGNPPTATVGYGCTRSSSDGTRYSGTDCTIIGTWQAGTGQTLTKVELWVGNVRRYVQEWSSGTGPTSWGLISRAFSSTQFAHNSTMTLRACFKTSTDGVY